MCASGKSAKKKTSSLAKAFSGWLLGFGSKPKADRLHGWIRHVDLHVQATARAVRTLHDARRHGGLLALAIKQLHYNWESARAEDKETTWYGLLNKEIRTVWPRFKLDSSSVIGWSGAPPPSPLDPKDTLGRRFSDAVWHKRWLERQVSVLTCRLEFSRQDYFLFHLLLVSCDDRLRLLFDNRSNIDRSLLLSSPIFATKPTVGTGHFRRLLRFTAGLEDFARINAHHPRRHAFPELADNHLKRTCLYCFTKMDVLVEDSEWHSFFYCPCTVRPSELFLQACPRFYSIFFSESPPPGMVVCPRRGPLHSLSAQQPTNQPSKCVIL